MANRMLQITAAAVAEKRRADLLDLVPAKRADALETGLHGLYALLEPIKIKRGKNRPPLDSLDIIDLFSEANAINRQIGRRRLKGTLGSGFFANPVYRQFAAARAEAMTFLGLEPAPRKKQTIKPQVFICK